MEDTMTISAILDTKGFEKGSAQLKGAINSLSKSAAKLGTAAAKQASSLVAPIKKLVPMILGAGSAYQVISKAVNAFMAQNKQLSSQMSAVWNGLGGVIGPIITQLISWVTTAVSYLLSFLKLLGVTGKNASQLSKAADGAGAKLQKTIAGFDELNVLQDNNGSGGATLKDLEPTAWMEALAELLKKGMWDEAGKIIGRRLNEMVDSIDWDGIGHKFGYYMNGAISVLAAAVREFDFKNLGNHIAEGFNAIVEELNGYNLGTLIATPLRSMIGTIGGFLEELDAINLAKKVSDVFIGFAETVSNTIAEIDWQHIGNNIADFIRNIDYAEIANAFCDLLYNAVSAAFELLWGLLFGEVEIPQEFIDCFESVKTAIERVSEVAQRLFDVTWTEQIKPMLEYSVLPAIAEVINIIADAITAVCNFIDEHVPESQAVITTAFEAIAAFFLATKIDTIISLVAALGPKLKALWVILSANPIGAVITIIALVITYFVNLYNTNEDFRQKVDEVWAKIKEIISDAVDKVRERFDKIKEGFNSLQQGAEDLKQRLTDKFNALKDKLSGIVDKIKALFNFQFRLPELRLPHIQVTWEAAGDLGRFFGISALPHLSIAWYKRGGIVDGATLIGAGEDGKEAIVPLERNTEWIGMVAQGLIDKLESSDFSFSKISTTLAALSNIADSVQYRTPVMATGSIVPYSVSTGGEYKSTSESAESVSELMRELYALVESIHDDLNTMQFVAQFGDLRALARLITKEQRRDTRAGGL